MERRADQRRTVTETGLVALDEHGTLACDIVERSASGVRIAAEDFSAVPELFVLSSIADATRVCRTVWRTPTEIGAAFEAARGGR